MRSNRPSISKLVELSNMEKSNKQKISSNYRDIQPLLDRPVYASFNTTESISHTKIRDINKPHRFQEAQFFKTLDEHYQQRIKGMRASMKKAFMLIDDARKKLLNSLFLTRDDPIVNDSE